MAQNFEHSQAKMKLTGGADIVSNLSIGGQLGYSVKAGAFDAATPLVLPPAVIVVTHTPEMWDHLGEDGKVFARTMKAMFETHAKSVSGIDVNYTVDPGDQPFGHDGQMFQVPLNVKRQAVQPVFSWSEVTGNLVWRMITSWIWDLVDPDTRVGLSRINGADGTSLMPYTMSAYALSFMALQFDQTMDWSRLIAAAYVTNVWPTGSQELGIKREIGAAAVAERSISFTGIQLHNDYIYALGQSVAKKLACRKGAFSAVGDPYSSSSANEEPNPNIKDGPIGFEEDSKVLMAQPGKDYAKAVTALS